MGEQSTEKLFAIVAYASEGAVNWKKYRTEAEAQAFKDGFDAAKEQSSADDYDILEDYFVGLSETEPKGEG